MGEQFDGRRLLDGLAGVHHHDVVGAPGHDAQVVGHEDHGHGAVTLLLGEQVEDLVLHRHIERRGRFVGEQHARTAGERDGDADPLAHAARHLVRVVVEPLLGFGDPDRLQQRDGDLVGLLAPHVEVIADVLGQLTPDRDHRVERCHRVLEDHRHLGTPEDFLLLGRLADHLVAGVHHRSGRRGIRRRVEPHDRARQHGLAGTGFADHTEGVPPVQLERHAVDRLDRTGGDSELRAQIVDDEKRFSLGLTTSRRTPDPDLVVHASPFRRPVR